MALQSKEERARATLTDVDFTGRDVISLICENDLIDLLEHRYIEKLAD